MRISAYRQQKDTSDERDHTTTNYVYYYSNHQHALLRGLLTGNRLLLAHGWYNRDQDLHACAVVLLNFITELALRKLDVLSPPIRFKSPSSTYRSWYSLRLTFGTSMSCVDGQLSSNFFPVKIWKWRAMGQPYDVSQMESKNAHVDGNDMDLVVTVLALWGWYLHDPAGAAYSIPSSAGFFDSATFDVASHSPLITT
jgi:hypothetical protein